MFLFVNDGTSPTEENRSDILALFDAIGVMHGEWFDDGRRWCGGCKSPKITKCGAMAGAESKVCQDCHSIWPEHVDEFTELLLDPDSEEDLADMMNYTLN